MVTRPRLSLLWILGGLLGGGGTSARAETVKLPYAVRPAGTTCSESMTIEVKVMVKQRTVERLTRIRKDIEVLASGPDGPTRAKVTYYEHTLPDGGGGAVLGPTYVVAFDGKAVSIARADGRALSTAERRIVEQDHKRFGKPDVFGKAIAGLDFSSGRRTQVPPERLAQWDGFPPPVDAALTLTEVRGARAHFKVEITAGARPAKPAGAAQPAEAPAPAGSNLSLSGTAIVERASGEVTSLVTDGTFAKDDATGTLRGTSAISCRR